MKKKVKKGTTVKKIDFDESTHEPIIVEISEEEYLKQQAEKAKLIDKEADFVKLKSQKGTRGQLAMKKVLGIKKEENISKRQKIFSRLMTVLFIVFVVGVLAYTAYNDFFAEGKTLPSWEELKSIFANSWYYLLLALLSFFLTLVFKGSKIAIMCKSMTGKFHFRTSLETGLIGTYYNNVTPLAVGGQPFEIYHLSKHGVHGGVAASIPLATFFLNQLAFVILGIASLVMFKHNTLGMDEALINAFPPLFKVLAIIGLVCCLFMPTLIIVFSMMPKIGAKLVHFVMWLGSKLRIIKNPKETTEKTIKVVEHNSHCLKKLATSPLVFILTFLLSFAENLALASIAYFTLKAFGFDIVAVNGIIEWLQICSLCILLYASITFIPTPGNSGAADLSFYLLFEVGLMAGLAFPAMLFWRLFSFYSIIILGFVFATLKKKSDMKKMSEQPYYEGQQDESFDYVEDGEYQIYEQDEQK